MWWVSGSLWPAECPTTNGGSWPIAPSRRTHSGAAIGLINGSFPIAGASACSRPQAVGRGLPSNLNTQGLVRPRAMAGFRRANWQWYCLNAAGADFDKARAIGGSPGPCDAQSGLDCREE